MIYLKNIYGCGLIANKSLPLGQRNQLLAMLKKVINEIGSRGGESIVGADFPS